MTPASSPASMPFPGHSSSGVDHDKVVKHGAQIDSLEAGLTRLENKLDKLTGWVIGVLASAVGALFVSIFNLIRHTS